MKKLVVFLCATLFALSLAGSASALLIAEGETAIYSFDFSALSPSPPYDDLTFSMNFDYQVGTSSIDFVVFDDLSDPVGSTLFYATIGLVQTTPDTFAFTFVNWPTEFTTFETTQYVSAEATVGTFDMNYLTLSMSHHVDGTIESTPTVTGQPIGVPEPSTMFLLASGIGGLMAFRKKMRK